MALDAGEPLLCDRPIGQHVAVPVALSLVVDQRSRTIGLSVYRRESRSGDHEKSCANSGYFDAIWDVPQRVTHNAQLILRTTVCDQQKRFSAALILGYLCDRQ